jgi:hypothetical protein
MAQFSFWMWSRSLRTNLSAGCSLDRQIDRLVYTLYGLTEEEVRIVEEGTQ